MTSVTRGARVSRETRLAIVPAAIAAALILGAGRSLDVLAAPVEEARSSANPAAQDKGEAPILLAQARPKLGAKEDKAAWAQVRKIGTCAAYHHYLRTFPKGRNVKSALKALKTCQPRNQRYRGPSRVYFNYYPPYLDPFWPWRGIPTPPIVVLPPDIIDPEPGLPIEPGPGPEPGLPIEPGPPVAVPLPTPEPEPELMPMPEPEPELMPMPMPDFGGDFDGGFDGGGDDGGDFGGDTFD